VVISDIFELGGRNAPVFDDRIKDNAGTLVCHGLDALE
jgi:hypothetical protein